MCVRAEGKQPPLGIEEKAQEFVKMRRRLGIQPCTFSFERMPGSNTLTPFIKTENVDRYAFL